MKRSAPTLTLALGLAISSPAMHAAEASAPAGSLITQEAFQSVLLSRSFHNDKIRDALGYEDSGPVRALDIDLDGDGKPERFIVGASARCDAGGCPFALLDGRTQKDIGTFFGTLIVLDRKDNGWTVLQTLGKGDEAGMSNLTTYTFQRVQYQPDDATLVDEIGLGSLVKSLRRRH